MATLTAQQLQQCRQGVARPNGITLNFTKTQANAGLQAIEDTLRNPTFVSTLKGNVDTAMGITTTNAQLKALFREWCLVSFGAGG